MTRGLRILSVTLITAGLVVIGDVGATLMWKEPLSSVYGAMRQAGVNDEVQALDGSFPAARGPSQAELRREARRLARRFADEAEVGKGIGTISIPALGVDFAIVEGTGTDHLQRGPGHYPQTKLPGQGGTVGVAGHRTTYMAPFKNIDALEGGDAIEVHMPYADFTYSVSRAKVVEPEDVGVIRDVGDERLVLTACHPLYSAAQRYVVFAELEQVTATNESG